MAIRDEARKRDSPIPILCKGIVLGLTIVIVGLIVDPTNNGVLAYDQNHSGIVYVTWPGYIVINTIFILGYIMGDRLPKRTNMLFALIGAVLYIISSGVSLSDYVKDHPELSLKTFVHQYKDQTIAAGIISLIAAVVFLLELFFSFKFL